MQKAQHRAFPRGPPPQYYPGSNLLNFAAFGWEAVSQADMAAAALKNSDLGEPFVERHPSLDPPVPFGVP